MATTSKQAAPGNAPRNAPAGSDYSSRELLSGTVIYEFRRAPDYVPPRGGSSDPQDADTDVLSPTQTELVVIGAEHPTLGYLYRRHVDESLSNVPDEYALTTDVATASPLIPEWRNHPGMLTRMGDRFLHRLLACSGSTDDRMCGHLESLQRLSTQDARAFFCWLHTAQWLDLPAPVGMRMPVVRL